MKRLLIFFAISPVLYFSQTSVFDCSAVNSIQLSQPEIEASNYYYQGVCIDMGSPDVYHFTPSKAHDIKAASQINLNPGFSAGTFNANGSMLLEINQTPFDVAVMNYKNLDGVLIHGKLELGVEIPENILEKINEFLNPGTSGQDQKINPYISHQILPNTPDGIKVTAIFEHLVANGGNPPTFQVSMTKTIHGFHYVPFETVEPDLPANPTPVPRISLPENLPSFLGTWNELETNYPFRIRYAPPKLGLWRATIKIETGGTVLVSPQFFFQVVPSDKKPGIVAGANKRYFERDGKSFFPVGLTLSWPLTYEEFDPQLGEFYKIDDKVINEDYRSYTARPRTYTKFREVINDLADNGANFFKFAMSPASSDIEFEEVGNYYHRQSNAYEMDKILFTAEARDLLIEWNCSSQHQFSTNLYGKGLWDWPEGIALDNLGNDVEHGNGYQYLPGVNSASDFFSNEYAMAYYKQKLRYIVSRWGYSNNIAFFELMMEIDLSLHNQPLDPADASPYDQDPYHWNDYVCNAYSPAKEQRQKDVYHWHKAMLEYLHNELGYDHRLYGVNYGDIGLEHNFAYSSDEGQTIDMGQFDLTFTIPELDVMTINKYNINEYFPTEGNEHNADRHFKFHSRVVPKFVSKHDPETGDCDGASAGAFQTHDYFSSNQKLFMFGETGHIGGGSYVIHDCDNRIEIVRDQWKMLFSGIAGGLDFNGHRKQYDHYDVFAAMNDFINADNIHLDEDEWHPGEVKIYAYSSNGIIPLWEVKESWEKDMLRDDLKAGLTYLRKGDKTQAIGMVDSHHWNFANGGEGGLTCDPPALLEGLDDIANVAPESKDKLRLHGMKPGVKYRIDFYTLDDINNPIAGASKEDWGPVVEIEFPELLADSAHYIYLFKVYPKNEGSFKQGMLEESAETILEEPQMDIYPNPNNGNFFVEITIPDKNEFLNGEIEVYTLQGNLIFKGRVTAEQTQLDLSKESGGMYVVRFVSENYVITKSVTKL